MKLTIKSKELGLADIFIDNKKISQIVSKISFEIIAGQSSKAIIEIIPEHIEIDTECKILIKELKELTSPKDKE